MFPHIINLACKAVLGKITTILYATANTNEYAPPLPLYNSFAYGLQWDVIAIVYSFTKAVCCFIYYYRVMI